MEKLRIDDLYRIGWLLGEKPTSYSWSKRISKADLVSRIRALWTKKATN
jgi:hypothetical protein